MIGILVSQDTTNKINCQALYTFEQLGGNASIGLSSINLAIRTMAIWNMDRRIVIPLVLVILGHWSLILQGVLLSAEWVDGAGCLVTKTNNTILAATFIYSMCFDLIVLVLSAIRLFRTRSSVKSPVVKLLFKDGLIYFLIAFCSNLTVTVFMTLDFNPVMSIVFNVPAACAGTIVASRVVRRLHKFKSAGTELYVNPSQVRSGEMAFASDQTSPKGGVLHPRIQTETNGIHIQMDTFTVAHSAEHMSQKMRDELSESELGLDGKHLAL
ncbi:hypothetical protein EUX98_g1388 [Antrodiella citrinella]|uniref:Uncharacterized protein n=1 Tax=Antrodiella citrinella TaxID=2447956 RepID=A0A4S4N4L0_9APHY|nr:hypothetical protein EUX98_g1388 [Antrodiella citrinella]